jgi:hypothetical protein
MLLSGTIVATSCEAPATIGVLLNEPEMDGGDGSIDEDGGPPPCPDAASAQFTLLDYFYPHYGPPGCTTAALTPPLELAASIDGHDLTLHVRQSDDTSFNDGSLLRVYVGQGPTCESPPNVWKNVAYVDVSVGKVQEITVQIDPYDSWWYATEIKQFWVGIDDALTSGFGASGMVLVQRRCIP